MTLREKPKPTGWESIDTLLMETYEAFNEYEAVRQKVEKVQSSFESEKPLYFFDEFKKMEKR